MSRLPLIHGLAAVAGACALMASAQAQDATPAIAGVVAAGTKIELIKEGFTGTEGPIALPDGSVAFTETQANRITRIAPSGDVQRLANDIERPNGIQLSPDDKVLYVANTAGEYVLAYDVTADGSVGPRRNFAKLDGWRKTDTGASSGADGLAVDANGRLYVASTVGIQVFSSNGDALGTIALPKAPQNLAFAGPDKKTLYVVGRGSAYKIAVLTPGVASRAK